MVGEEMLLMTMNMFAGNWITAKVLDFNGNTASAFIKLPVI